MTILAVANATSNGKVRQYSVLFWTCWWLQTITLYYSSSQFAGVSSSEHGGVDDYIFCPGNIGSGRSLMVFKLKFNDQTLDSAERADLRVKKYIYLGSALDASTISAYPERGGSGGLSE